MELLVVMTLIVITALTATFSLLRFNQTQAPQSTVRSIAAVLRDAQQRAIVQEDGMYWGVYFENLADRDRYTLFKSPNSSGSPRIDSSVFYLNRSISLFAPATTETVMFNKINGNLVSASCPTAAAAAIITIAVQSVRVYCNGKIE